MKILVVDDFTANRKIVTNNLKELGFDNIYEVSDGYSAIVSLKSSLFDCVIAEWDMKQMNGLELLKYIRSDSYIKNTPVLIVMEDDIIENIVLAYKEGVNDCVIKPFKKDTFSKVFKKMF